MENKNYIRKANYYETDRMGIVHHSNHIRYFEEARISFMNSIGCDVMILENEGVIIPNVDAYAKYIKPIRFSDEVYIEVKLVKFNGAVMKYEYTVRFCSDNSIAATGFTTHCFVGKDFRPISIKKKYPEFYERLNNALEAC